MTALKAYARRVEARLQQLLDCGDLIVAQAMRYSVSAGGKRLRPAMLLAAADMLGGADEALDFACAVEMIHTYSLVHDDLPGMDDDTLRRGRPTNHVVFGEGQAILAGDGLLNSAFEVMLAAAERAPGRERACLLAMAEIARGAGVAGMIGGQCLDLDSERNGVAPEARQGMLERIQHDKTACMFIHPLRAAGRLCGADEATLAALESYGEAFGLLFQATDDLLDVVGEAAELGKTPGKDAQTGKLTCVSVFGMEKTRERVKAQHARAVEALAAFGEGAAFLRELVDAMVERTK